MLAARMQMAAAGNRVAGFYGDLRALGLTAGLKLMLDAGDAASWSGSGQQWADRSGGGYDFFRGASNVATTDDPTFNGTPGGLSSSEYWSFDGGDFLDYDGGANEAWMSALHQNGAQWGALVWFYKASGAADQHLLSTARGPSLSNAGVKLGVGLTSFDRAQIDVFNDAGNVALRKTGDTSLSNSAWHLIGVSIDENAGAAGGFLYLDGDYEPVGGSDTWNPAYNTPGAGAADLMCIGSASTPNRLPLPNGSRIAGVMVWQGVAPSKANYDAIWNRQKVRFGL